MDRAPLLLEIKDVRQPPGESRRRWFRSENQDLIVWYATDDALNGFQLCYGDRALTWKKGSGYSHLKVDDGEVEPLAMKRTAILVPDGLFEPMTVLERFNSAAASLPEDIKRFVAEKIREYS